MERRGYDTDVSDAEWGLLEPLVLRQGTMGRPVELDLREIVNTLFYWERTGCQWRLIPADFPSGAVYATTLTNGPKMARG